jgi:hypothetical protein
MMAESPERHAEVCDVIRAAINQDVDLAVHVAWTRVALAFVVAPLGDESTLAWARLVTASRELQAASRRPPSQP